MSSGPYLMTLAEKQARRAKIVEHWHDGMQPGDIARRYGLTANYVRLVLNSSGVDVEAENGTRALTDRMWELPEDELRDEIARRAAKAARARLNEMGAQ